MKGVYSYVYVCNHEQGHGIAWLTPGVEDLNSDPLTGTSLDGDMVVDAWEDDHHMNHHFSDTTYAYGSTDATGHIINPATGNSTVDVPDNELIADIVAAGRVLGRPDLWAEDWADGGIQKGSLYFSPDDFYWKFYPSEVSTVAYPLDASGNALPYYKVTGVHDLEQLYPGTTVATDWAAIQGSCPPELP